MKNSIIKFVSIAAFLFLVVSCTGNGSEKSHSNCDSTCTDTTCKDSVVIDTNQVIVDTSSK
jgi:hypothetical protein